MRRKRYASPVQPGRPVHKPTSLPQALKAKQIAEGRFLGPKQPQEEADVEYEPWDLAEGVLCSQPWL